MGFYRGTYGIATNGLFYAMDSGSRMCYSGSGTIVKNIANINNPTQGTLTGATWDGKYFDFTTAGDRIGTGFSYIGSPYLSTGNSSYTLEAWVYNRAGYGVTLASAGIIGTANATGVGLQIENNAFVNFGMRSNSNFAGGTSLIDNTWYHIAGIRDSVPATATNRIYVNGVQDAANDSNTVNDIDTSTAELQIGEAQTRLTGVFDGKIAIVRMYNVALTPAELLNNYNIQKSRFK